ncbi:MAG: patatin-like phospholipase family protein [Deltaproteobacteria bacterium]|nr:patatin-like phospholipase family protein [Deltaproteobacteria bacterium]
MERQALVLAGGGARAAYQVGCLRAIARRVPEYRPKILTGVSAGAINAAHLASFRGNWLDSVEALSALWLALDTEKVFRTEARHLLLNMWHSALPLVSGGRFGKKRLRGMVDTEPLRQYLESALHIENGNLKGVRQNIEDGLLDSLAIITTNYETGRSTAWIESKVERDLGRGQVRVERGRIGLAHVMASSALPLFFPAVAVGNAWHGDGGIRLTAPLSPALHLGASRILAVSPRMRPPDPASLPALPELPVYPSPGQIGGVLMNAVFLDALDFDALQMSRINRLVEALPEESQKEVGLRPVEVMVLRPSCDLGALARRNEFRLPRAFRFFEKGLTNSHAKSSDVLSMVIFEPEFLRELIDLGERDTAARGDEIEAFLRGEACSVPVW